MYVLTIDDDSYGYIEKKNLLSLCPKKNILSFNLSKKNILFFRQKKKKKTVSPKITQPPPPPPPQKFKWSVPNSVPAIIANYYTATTAPKTDKLFLSRLCLNRCSKIVSTESVIKDISNGRIIFWKFPAKTKYTSFTGSGSCPVPGHVILTCKLHISGKL